MSGLMPAIEPIFMYMAALFGAIATVLIAIQFALFLARKLVLELREIRRQWCDLRRSVRTDSTPDG